MFSLDFMLHEFPKMTCTKDLAELSGYTKEKGCNTSLDNMVKALFCPQEAKEHNAGEAVSDSLWTAKIYQVLILTVDHVDKLNKISIYGAKPLNITLGFDDIFF